MRNLVCLFADHSRCKGQVMEVATRGKEPTVPCCQHHHTGSIVMSKSYSPQAWHEEIAEKEKGHE